MNYVYAILALLLRTGSVDKAVAALTQVAKKLAAAEAIQKAEVGKIDAQITSLTDARNAALEAAAKAGRIVEKLNELTA